MIYRHYEHSLIAYYLSLGSEHCTAQPVHICIIASAPFVHKLRLVIPYLSETVLIYQAAPVPYKIVHCTVGSGGYLKACLSTLLSVRALVHQLRVHLPIYGSPHYYCHGLKHFVIHAHIHNPRKTIHQIFLHIHQGIIISLKYTYRLSCLDILKGSDVFISLYPHYLPHNIWNRNKTDQQNNNSHEPLQATAPLSFICT